MAKVLQKRTKKGLKKKMKKMKMKENVREKMTKEKQRMKKKIKTNQVNKNQYKFKNKKNPNPKQQSQLSLTKPYKIQASISEINQQELLAEHLEKLFVLVSTLIATPYNLMNILFKSLLRQELDI